MPPTGNHIWSERYDGDLTDIFDLQDRVTEAIVGAIEPTITLSEIERAKRKRPDSLDAYDCVMRALPAVWSHDTETTAEGLRLAEQAIALDPDLCPAESTRAHGAMPSVSPTCGPPDPAEDRAKAIKLAQEAASLDSNDPLVLTVLSACVCPRREVRPRARYHREGARLGPELGLGVASQRLGELLYASNPDKAIEHFHRSMRLSPLDPMHFNALVGIGAAHFGKGQYDEAARWIEQALREKPSATWVYRLLTTTYANAGRLEEAKQAAAKLLEAFPDLTVSKAIDAAPGQPDTIVRYAQGLREAGLPEQ